MREEDAAMLPLLADYLSGEASQDEIDRLERWIGDNAERQALVAHLRKSWESAEKPLVPVDSSAMKRALHARIAAAGKASEHEVQKSAVHSRSRATRWTGYAIFAGCILAAAVTWQAWKPATHTQTSSFTTYTTKPGQRATVTLADGSTVILAPATTMRVSSRNVDLMGEAHFTVTSKSIDPFIVNASGITTRVLGTSFMVRKYSADKSVRVIVGEGRVSSAGRVIGAGEGIDVTTSSVVTLPAAEVARGLAWTSGRLTYQLVALSEVVRDMERWCGVRIVLDGTGLDSLKVTGVFDSNSSANTFQRLADALDVSVLRNGNIVTFSQRR